MTFKLFVVIQSCYMLGYIFLGSTVPELPDMRTFVYLRRSPPHGLQIRFPSRYKSTTFTIPVRLRYYKPRSNVFYRSGPCVRSRVSLTNITPRVEGRSMYLSCIYIYSDL